MPDGAVLSAAFVRRCARDLAALGYEKVVTGALAPAEHSGFLQAGFMVYEDLHLLTFDPSGGWPELRPGPRLHRAGPRRRRQVLRVDELSFSPFWRLDATGLREAVHATTDHRLRVALAGGRVSGYAICGAAGGRGFVQRLAVLPEARGQGLGKRLLVDGLYWLRDRGVRQVAVNTQQGNDVALALYRSVGFTEAPEGLAVLSADLRSVGAPSLP